MEERPAAEDIRAVSDIIGSVLVALRNYSLYPEDHAVCRKSLAVVRDRLDGFLAGRESLMLTIEKERFLFGGEPVGQSVPQQEELTFQLFREGIQWLEFHPGITQEELGGFFGLINRYRTVKEDAEGDLVTALWEADFHHLKYHNEDVLWEAEPLLDFSLLKASPGEAPAAQEQEDEDDRAAPAVRVSLPEASIDYWKLTPEEEGELAALILDEETRDSTEDVLEVLMIILKEQREPGNFSVILDFLVEEFRYTLAEGEFSFARKFLESLAALQESCAPERPWTRVLLDDFRKQISGPEVLGALQEAWPQVETMDAGRREELRQALLLFSPEAIISLAPLLAGDGFPRAEELLRGVFGVHAGRDLQPLERLLETAAEPLVRKLIPVLGELEGPGPAELLFGLANDAPEQVRRDAIKTLLARDPENIRRLFPLIEDPRPAIRRLVLEQLGKQRNPAAEELLREYLEHERFRMKDGQHLIACWLALGRCASPRSLPFLEGALLKKDWKAFLGIGGGVPRRGAALALLAMKNEAGARVALQKASRSLLRGVRSACRWAAQEDQRMRRQGR